MHAFILLNAAIIFAYLLTRSLLQMPWLNTRLLQRQKLQFARVSLIASGIVFLLMPYCSSLHPIVTTSLSLQPMFVQTSLAIADSQAIAAKQLSNTQHIPLQLSLNSILIAAWLCGVAVSIYFYSHSIKKLQQLKDSAFCQHKIKNIFILYAEAYQTPFCWAWLHKSYMVLPTQLLENFKDKRLTIRHELQHLRQGDAHWLHALNMLTILCYFNPCAWLWKKYLSELQEFACDEAIILRNKSACADYAECLVNAVKMSLDNKQLTPIVIAIDGMSKTTLFRRINMLFNYKRQQHKLALIVTYLFSLSAISSTAFALQNITPTPISATEVNNIIQKDHLESFKIQATPEVLAELNRIRATKNVRDGYLAGLKRMKDYQSGIQEQLDADNLPHDLLAMPLIQTRYEPLDESLNRVKAAGIWQIIPSTAIKLGLTVNSNRDDRLDTQLSTQAALKYLKQCHEQFGDWKLAVIAYEIGENATETLIKKTGSRDAWTMARSPESPKELKEYLAMYDAAVIIIHKPSIITG